jgi:uncharacterized LabA/DUF88 family protein
MVDAAVVIDYQNIHLTAHGRFCPNGEPVHECLIHPLYLANQILLARQASRRLASVDSEPASLATVSVFRGLPSNSHSPSSYRRNQAQKSEWTKDRRVLVTYRPLRYSYDAAGVLRVQEKGIDVQVALEVLRLTQGGRYGLVILAAHDTDQEPTLEYALELENVRDSRVLIETAGWHQCKRLRAASGPVWHTVLDRGCFDRSIDRKSYL